MDGAGDLRGTTLLVTVVALLNLLFTRCLFVKGDVCGKPGRPLGGNYNPIKIAYSASEEVVYSCDLRNGYLKGNYRRSCLLNGSWSGFVPTCDTNLAFEKIVSGTEQRCLKKSLVDNNRDTFCTIFSGQLVVIDLGLESDISYVLLTLKPNMFYSFNVDLTDIRNVKRQCKAVQNRYIKEVDFKLVCNNGNSLRGKQLTVTFYGTVPVYEIGAYSNEVKSCGEPDVPANGIWSKTGFKTKGKFSCEQSYFLQGESSSWCVNGQWNTTGHSCERAPAGWQECGKPGFPLHGDRHVEGKLLNESNYFCSEGFALVGDQMRKCSLNSTDWSSTIPKCVTNVAFKKSASYPLSTFTEAFSTDENLATCESQTDNFFGHMYIDLLKETNFNNIYFSFISGTDWLVGFTIYVTNNTNIKSPTFKDSSNLKSVCFLENVNPSKPLRMRCSYSGIIARYIVLHFSQAASVCEVIAFNSNEAVSCGQPDQPLHGRILNRSAALTTYTCETGFKMSGSESTRCVNGVWSNRPPLCLPVTVVVAPEAPFFTSTSTKKPITFPTWLITTSSHDVTDDGDEDSNSFKTMGAMGVAMVSSAIWVVIILLSLLVYRFVRKRYRNRNRDQNRSSRDSPTEYYTTTYQIQDRESGGNGDDVYSHQYETIEENTEEPDYLIPLTPANAADTRCTTLPPPTIPYRNNVNQGRGVDFVGMMQVLGIPPQLPHKAVSPHQNTPPPRYFLHQESPLYDLASPDVEAAHNKNRMRTQ